jgi:putative Ca2+/H+ antiporter (TMEM165/GDT1 family)
MSFAPDVALSSFGIVFLAELPDKTALASLVLATHLPPRQVVVGAWLAFLVQTLVAVVAGSVLQFLPTEPVRIAAGIGFLVFAFMALRRNVEKETDEAQQDVTTGRGRRSPPWVASFLVVFAAEWGDLTQLATASLVAHTGQPLEVGLGALAALWAVTLIAVTAGAQMARFASPVVLNRISAVLFAAIGLFIIVSTLRAS